MYDISYKEANFSQVEKEIGQVWRQMGIMYAQVSSSISILEKVSANSVVGWQNFVFICLQSLAQIFKGQVTKYPLKMVIIKICILFENQKNKI